MKPEHVQARHEANTAGLIGSTVAVTINAKELTGTVTRIEGGKGGPFAHVDTGAAKSHRVAVDAVFPTSGARPNDFVITGR